MNLPAPGLERTLPPGREAMRWLVLANVGVLVLITVLLVSTLTASRAAHRQRAFDAVDSLARGLERNIEAELARVDFALRLAALASAEPGHPPSAQVLADLRRLVPQAENLRLLGDSGLPPAQRAAAQAAVPGRLQVAGLRQAGPEDRWVIDLLQRLDRPAGQPGAWVAAELDVRQFERLFSRPRPGRAERGHAAHERPGPGGPPAPTRPRRAAASGPPTSPTQLHAAP